jgi:purine-binding chemotaxis protein CheW
LTKLTQTFISPKEALSSYLDDMLEDAVSRAKEDEVKAENSQITTIEPEEIKKSPEPKKIEPRVRPKAISSVIKVAELKEVPKIEIKPSIVPIQKKPAATEVIKKESTVLPAIEENKESFSVKNETPEEIPPVAPTQIDWQKEKNFDCLLFKVDGLSLAVPMVLLGNIHPMNSDSLTPLFDQPEWFLGLLTVTSGETIRVLDTAKLVMPERYNENSAKDLKYVIGVHGSSWGFGCHEIVGSATFESGDIKWRKNKAQRPWLAGTVIEYMCALIDLQATNALMESSSLIKR